MRCYSIDSGEWYSSSGVHDIRETIYDHFSSHFSVVDVERPGVEDLNFHKLSMAESSSLTRPFTLDEVKQTIWHCDSYRSLGSDEVSFSFIKQFWEELKSIFCFLLLIFTAMGS